jgi:hypothetical protein
MARLDALDPNTQAQPPDREPAEAVERIGRREGHAVIGADSLGQAEVLKGPLEDAEGVALLRGRQRFAREQVATRVVGDG